MRGLLADANIEGHVGLIQKILERIGLWRILVELKVEFVLLSDIGLPPNVDDRTLWQCCQQGGWVLFTDNRNDEDATSLQATLNDSWVPGSIPVLTLADKKRFERMAEYRERVAVDIADVLFGITDGEFLDRGRIYIPR